MNLQRIMFGAMYRLRFTPWEGHPTLARLTELVEGPTELPPGRAIDLGCGTGEASTYLAQRGWTVTGVDFVDKALRRARARAAAANVEVRWLHADATRLREVGVGDGFSLVLDYGLLHGLSDRDRDAYVAEVNAITTPDAAFLLAAFPVGARRAPPRGINRDEIERRFATWHIASSGQAGELTWYELRRQRT